MLFSLLSIIAVRAQTTDGGIISRPNPNATGIGYKWIAGDSGILKGTFAGKPPMPPQRIRREKKAISAYDTLNHQNWTYDPSVNDWLPDATGGGTVTIIPAGPTTSVPPAGFNPGTNITADEFIKKAFYDSQNPTASLSGGQQIELMAAGAVLPFTLSWSAGRNSATAPIQSVVVAGVSKTFTPPNAGASISGTQAVSVTRNSNTTYSIVVTTTDGKTTTASTSFPFSPKRYVGWATSATPTDAEIIAAVGGSSEFASNKSKSWILPAPGGTKYAFYAYPESFGALTQFDINKVTSIGAITQTHRAFTNASGYTQNYIIAVTINPSNVTITTSIDAN